MVFVGTARKRRGLGQSARKARLLGWAAEHLRPKGTPRLCQPQVPLLQTWPEAQRLPQPPQFFTSTSTFTHAPSQALVPSTH
jgi:hypothetical protein